tara:strand:+ start:616 stop:822 length:207 start_codon:yes stop_codon:yes gene_type:complete
MGKKVKPRYEALTNENNELIIMLHRKNRMYSIALDFICKLQDSDSAASIEGKAEKVAVELLFELSKIK